eukprot:4262008-Ditylum_brightwellii.AAC.1
MGWANPQEEAESHFNLNKNALHSQKRMAIDLTMSDEPKPAANNNKGQQIQNDSQKNTVQAPSQQGAILPEKIPEN